MPANNSPAFFIVKGNGPGKPGLSSAGFEPDNLAGVTGFAISSPKRCYDVFFLYDTFIFLNKATDESV